jgi:NADP-dependent aldehyde dehydrogenase
MEVFEVLLGGTWRRANAVGTFRAENPGTGEALPGEYPVSGWEDCDLALDAAARAAVAMEKVSGETLGDFLEAYASGIEARAEALVEMAHLDTGLAKQPRLSAVELPRTTSQLRQAAGAAREESWRRPVLDTQRNIRSFRRALGPVLAIGPNNFPFAFNGISGGDFAAAIACGNPVIAKAHPLHPGTSRLLAEAAFTAAESVGFPAGAVQMLYHLRPEDGIAMVEDRRLAALAFTGSRGGGMALKAAADKAGKVSYLEMSSTNPVAILPGALRERSEAIAGELADSCLAAAGQFCTSPNLIFLVDGPEAEGFLKQVAALFATRAPSPLFSAAGLRGVSAGLEDLVEAGAEVVTGGAVVAGSGFRHQNTLLRVTGAQFRAHAELEREVFGNVSMAVFASDADELVELLSGLEGNLTGTIYSAASGSDDGEYARVAAALSRRVGRLLNDKMPTGVAVSPAMNHGGPYPSTGHPGFTAVGIPASLERFTALQCFDNVRPEWLPAALQDKNPNGRMWREIDGVWTMGDVAAQS